MRSLIRRFASDDSGASALEYGLVVGLIALLVIAGLSIAGGALQSIFNLIGVDLSAVAANATSA